MVVFFGFTQCPDVLPDHHGRAGAGQEGAGRRTATRCRACSSPVDPERDTPEVLKGYVSAFDPSFVALRGTPEQAAAVAKDFKVFYSEGAGQEPGSYTMDHSAGVASCSTRRGKVRLYARYGAGAEALASDLKQLLRRREAG